MPDEFGQPDLANPVGRRDRRIQRSSDKRVTRLQKIEELMTRPIGAKVPGRREQAAGWLRIVEQEPERILGEAQQKVQAQEQAGLPFAGERIALDIMKRDVEARNAS